MCCFVVNILYLSDMIYVHILVSSLFSSSLIGGFFYCRKKKKNLENTGITGNEVYCKSDMQTLFFLFYNLCLWSCGQFTLNGNGTLY